MLTVNQLKNLPKNPNQQVANAGKDTILYIESNNDFVLVGGQRNSPLSLGSDNLDGFHKTSGSWGASIPGIKNWSINYEGLQILSDEGLQILEYAFRNDQEIHVKLVYKNKAYREGWAYVTSFEDNNAHTDIHTVSVTLTGIGPISDFQLGTTHEITSVESLLEQLATLDDYDTLEINGSVDTSNNGIILNGKQNVNVVLNDNVTTDGGKKSGIRIESGSATISGTGTLATSTPYDSNHGSGVIGVYQDADLTIDGISVDAVITDDPVNKGQFGICVYKNGHLTINDGDFTTGWYCVAGNGNAGNSGSVITINGGDYTSVADYVIYHPQDGTLVINGGTFAGAAGAIAANRGTIIINGGEFSVLGGGNTGDWQDGTSGLANVAINLNAKYGDVTCRITGGKFNATAAGTIMIAAGTAHNVDLQISGGKFTAKPNNAWIATGYICTDTVDENGYYTVVPTE